METLAVILPAIATGSVVLLTGLSLYFKIRYRFPITVNCWFCNRNSEVPFGNRNCWDCPHCDQYNGFMPDGSYNKVIPAQHDELLNHPVNGLSNNLLDKKLVPSDVTGNGLCRKCNTNQELKVQQLAAFTPVIPAHYDDEVDEFSRHLERAYRLCSQCEDFVKKTLHKEKCDLLGIRLKHSRSAPILAVYKMKLYRFIPTKMRLTLYLSTLLSVGLSMATSYRLNKDEIPLPEAVKNSTVWTYLPSLTGMAPALADLFPILLHYEIIVAATCAIVHFIISLNRKHKIDYLCVCLWMLLHIQCWIRKSGYLEKYISLLDFNIIHVAVTVLTLLASTCSALISGRKFKASNYRTSRSFNSSSESSIDISRNSEDSSLEDSRQINDSSLQKTNTPETFHKKDEKTTILNNPVTKYLTSNITQMKRTPSPVASTQFTQLNNSEDVDWGLGKLSLGTDQCDKWLDRRNSSPSSYDAKLYGQNNYYDSFNRSPDSGLRNRNRPIIKPSQLNFNKNATQSSWVAGGYWQSPMHNRLPSPPKCGVQEVANSADFAPLSRSSSQSSGFVSQSSQVGLYDGAATSLPNSRTGSFGGDFDRFSALSEPVYPYSSQPVYFANTRTVPYFYQGPIILPQTYDMVPPGYVTNYAFPQARPAIAPTSCFYPPQPPRPVSAIWNPSVFSSTQERKCQSPVPTPPRDVLSRSSSRNSEESVDTLTKSKRIPSPRERTLFSAIKENMFLATLFCCSLLFNALVFVGVILGNTNLVLPKVI
ncbi:hypothetical protein C0J52_17844 [Blattella germanica]|nr:hypothetical protein C0J52_17844 [Blattella germanica]